jgi:hypothetical protein
MLKVAVRLGWMLLGMHLHLGGLQFVLAPVSCKQLLRPVECQQRSFRRHSADRMFPRLLSRS